MPRTPKRFKPPPDLPASQVELYWLYLKELYKAESRLKHGFNLFRADSLDAVQSHLKSELINKGYVANVSGIHMLTDKGNQFCRICKNHYGLA